MSEVFQWLSSISNGLGLERLAEDFESRGFSTVGSLKYFRSSDLDVLFPTPQKLKMAEKGILETELAKLNEPKTVTSHNLQPRELFPGSNPPTAAAVGFTPIVSSMSIMASPAASTPFLPNQFSVNQHNSRMYLQSTPILPNQSNESQNSSSTYLDKRQAEMKQDQELMTAKKRSVEELLKEKTLALDEYKESSSRRQKICSHCHLPGHNKTKCKNGPCNGIANCRYSDKHPEIKSEIQELKRILKDLEKKEDKTKNDYDVFKAARERAS